MANVKDKIKKLLALSTSPNKHEASAAMEKARELMVANGLTDSDFNEEECTLSTVVVKDAKWTTDSGDTWMVALADLLVNEHFCVGSWFTESGTRTHTLSVTGVRKDVEMCASFLKYAVKSIRGDMNKLVKSRKCTKNNVNSYAFGFVEGLTLKMEDSKADRDEWALTVGVSKEVKEFSEKLQTKSVKCKQAEHSVYAYMLGVKDGLLFAPGKMLEVSND